jgi:hypothetical protein
MLTPDELEALARKHGATSYRNRADTAHPAYGFSEAGLQALIAEAQAATLATVTPLVQLALEELDDGYEHAQDCMRICGSQYKCKCQKPATLAKLRAFLSGATKESTDHG